MAVGTFIAAIGVAASIAGTIVAYQGAQKQAKAQKQALAHQMRAEELRKRQMEIDSTRKQRQMIRESQQARAKALAVSTAQGSADSTGLQGAYGQISGQSGVNVLGVRQNEEIGAGIFEQNRLTTMANMRAASAGGMVATGQGLSSFGGALVNNAGTLGKIGSFMTGGRLSHV
jgi:hypothetical protein